jgi:SAM-dependent methyltransferase
MLDHELHNRAQQDYYAGDLKTRMRPVSTPYVLRHVEEVIRFGGLRPGQRVLEGGCGAGRYSFLLAGRGLEVEGLELSPVLADRLREFDAGQHRIPVHCGDVANPPAALEGRFDAVTGFFMLHHLDDLTAAFRGFSRCLRPGGRAVFVEPNAWNPLYYLQVALTKDMRWAAERGIKNMRPGVLAPAMREAGLEDPEFRTFGFFPPFLRNTSWGGGVESLLECAPGLGPVLPFRLIRARKP